MGNNALYICQKYSMTLYDIDKVNMAKLGIYYSEDDVRKCSQMVELIDIREREREQWPPDIRGRQSLPPLGTCCFSCPSLMFSYHYYNYPSNSPILIQVHLGAVFIQLIAFRFCTLIYCQSYYVSLLIGITTHKAMFIQQLNLIVSEEQ